MTDAEQYIADLAREVLAAPQPMAGLTRQQARLVRILCLKPGHVHPAHVLAALVANDPLDPPGDGLVAALVCNIGKRRPDIVIGKVRCYGYVIEREHVPEDLRLTAQSRVPEAVQ